MSASTAAPAEAVKSATPLYKSLFVQVIIALLLGIVLGMAALDFAVQLRKVLSDGSFSS